MFRLELLLLQHLTKVTKSGCLWNRMPPNLLLQASIRASIPDLGHYSTSVCLSISSCFSPWNAFFSSSDQQHASLLRKSGPCGCAIVANPDIKRLTFRHSPKTWHSSCLFVGVGNLLMLCSLGASGLICKMEVLKPKCTVCSSKKEVFFSSSIKLPSFKPYGTSF